MLFTRECDYAIRILRALSGSEIVNVQDISKRENISIQMAYKLTRKLEKSGIIKSYRGVNGGYALKVSLKDLTLFELFTALEQNFFMTECTNHSSVVCSQNTAEKPCMVHKEFCRLQEIMYNEMKRRSLLDIINGT
ncbi:RrF2 family transcriptional regulator [Clostridium aminobutyricum]|uniref:Rrf2 family transcriptional regulator n=1 Tax=Clostridium aminobutyricum TaxID=33953 RepID=A0A939IGN8_CLOAM|nr:Rrf2 family transcriptional regulator [Clostridium aminobutyricum]MBN7772212.1 Rrf2 family transcriptional regulator [Clostridium aminobutyricum]